MPMSKEEREREAQEAADAQAAHAKFLEDKAAGTLPEGADDPEPDVEG